jgi:hypothetical protein
LKALSLKPPHLAVDADLAWLLRLAFSDVMGDPRPADPARALQLARATQLSGRVAKRLMLSRDELSSAALAAELDQDFYANIANEALLSHARDKVAELGDRLGIPIIAVKFAGLQLAGVVAPGTRSVSDVDVLLPKAQARRFWRALLDVGFVRTGTSEYSHQLEALVDPYGAVIDLHLHLPGVSVETGSFASADQLLARGLIDRTRGALLVPDHAVLAAHAIAHALVQNRSTPQTYSPLRMVSDLMDLRRVAPGVVSSAARYLAPELAATCGALERLCAALSRGAFVGPGFDGTSEQTVLWHCIAARLDFGYSERLRAAGLTNKFRDGSSVREIARYIVDLLYPAEPALEVLYGPAAGRLGRLRRRLLRPVDLAARAARRWNRSR